MHRGFLVVALVSGMPLCLGCAGLRHEGSGQAAKQMPADPFRVIAYVLEYGIEKIAPSAYGRVTDAILFSAVLEEDGTFPADALAAAPVARFRDIKRDHPVRTHLCFGGWGRSTGFAAMTSDALKRKSFIAALSRFCIANGFDGVDYDWEFPRNRAEHAAYGLLLIDTAEAFRPHGLEVSVALGSRQKLDPPAYAAVDRIHLMTYDMGARHSTYDKTVSAVARLVKSGAPRRKICLGIPFYGRKIDHAVSSMAYAEILRNYAPAPDEDEAGGFYFNNAETIRRKVRYALAEGLKGVMIWEMSMDTRGETSLLRAIEAEVGRPAASSKAVARAGKKGAQN